MVRQKYTRKINRQINRQADRQANMLRLSKFVREKARERERVRERESEREREGRREEEGIEEERRAESTGENERNKNEKERYFHTVFNAGDVHRHKPLDQIKTDCMSFLVSASLVFASEEAALNMASLIVITWGSFFLFVRSFC